MYHSGRSTPVAGSIMGDKASFQTNYPLTIHDDTFNHSLTHPTDTTYTAADYKSHLRSSLRNETLQPPVHENRVSEAIQRQYFCTFCAELGTTKIIKTKQDWKRHEEDYHNGTGLQWLCPVNSCSRVFYRGVEFKQHLKKDHEGKKYSRDCKEVRQMPHIYACGFENCKQLDETWKDHCDHVASHMSKGQMKWTYDRTIRNLLKHQDISRHWKDTYNTLGPQMGVVPNELTWDVQTTRPMRDELERRSMEGKSGAFLQNLFFSGIPLKDRNLPIRQPMTDMTSQSMYNSSLPIMLPVFPGLGFGHSFVDTDFALNTNNTTGNEAMTSSRQHRNSILMTDAPPIDGPGSFSVSSTDLYEEIPSMADEQISIEKFIAEVTPDPLPDIENRVAAPGLTKSHSPRSLMNKSREWLGTKKSQSYQAGVMEHPDLPANMRLPSSSPRKKSHTAAPRIHNYQS